MSAPSLSLRSSLLSPPISRSKLSTTSLPLNRPPRLLNFLPKSSKTKWKFSCFRHEETSSEFLEAKNEEDKLPELLVNPEFNQSQAENEDWVSTLKKFQLEDAIEMEDFQEAARLKMAIVEATSKDSVAEIMSQMKNAVEEERYHDDLQLCRCTGSGLVVFLQQAKSLTNSTSSLSNSKPTQGPITSETEDASVVNINRNEVKAEKSEGKSINVEGATEEGITNVINFLKDKIPELKLKVMKINVIEEVIEDADALKQLMQEDSENTPGKDSDDETNNLIDGAIEDGKNLDMEVFIGGILHNMEDISTKDECVRLPAEIKDMERDSFVLHVPARGQDRDTNESIASKSKWPL